MLIDRKKPAKGEDKIVISKGTTLRISAREQSKNNL